MFDKVLKAFWKALTPDLVADEPGKPASILDKTVLAALAHLSGYAGFPLAVNAIRIVAEQLQNEQ